MKSNNPSRIDWQPGRRPGIGARKIDIPNRQSRLVDGVSSYKLIVQPIDLNEAAAKKTHRSAEMVNSGHASLPPGHSHARRRHHKHLSKVASKAMLLDDAVKTESHKINAPIKRRSIFNKQLAITAVMIAVLSLTTYVSVDTWLTNRRVNATVGVSPVPSTSQKAKSDATTNVVAESDGRPDQTPLPKNALETYVVPARDPRAIYIKKVRLAARILPMSVDVNGALQAPRSAYDAGWYSGSARPGEKGAMLFDGHTSATGNYGAFGKIHTLTNGDTITIQSGDGTDYVYKVVATETVSKDSVDMKKASRPYEAETEGANFITCAGTWLNDAKTMTERTIVYTTRI